MRTTIIVLIENHDKCLLPLMEFTTNLANESRAFDLGAEWIRNNVAIEDRAKCIINVKGE